MASKSYEKMLDEIGDMSVLDLADFVKALEDKFGVSAAMPVAATPSGPMALRSTISMGADSPATLAAAPTIISTTKKPSSMPATFTMKRR